MSAQERILLKGVWIVVQENEGLLVEAFIKHKDALARARQLSRRCPSVRTEIAKYLVALNSRKVVGAKVEEDDD